jgi:TonB family protein
MGGTERSLDGPAGIGGEGPGGGGTVRGLEFVVYYNQMLTRIKERWTWVGTRGDLRVTVQFSILPSGEITSIRLGERSGDQSYDASVERAVKGAGPLPPPPEAYRSDFADVELTFRPADLQR